VVHLTPATAWLAKQALRAYATRPTREEIVAAICGGGCNNPAACTSCIGKANVVLRLFAGDPDRRGAISEILTLRSRLPSSGCVGDDRDRIPPAVPAQNSESRRKPRGSCVAAIPS
jgi:hypothetical protein